MRNSIRRMKYLDLAFYSNSVYISGKQLYAERSVYISGKQLYAERWMV